MKISNSKKELARIISENGGWRDGSEFSVQNGEHGRISFSTNKPVRHGQKSWMAKGGFQFKIEVCRPLPNWHQTILSRAEYFHLYPAPDADGWIEWKGGECPVERGAIVDVKYANNIINYGVSALTNGAHKGHVCGTAGSMTATNWEAGLQMSGIIAYRPHKPEQADPEFCESVMRSIPEPEAKPTIEQLAADRANMECDASLYTLEEAIAANVFAITPLVVAKQEPELVITDWRDLRLGDELEYVDGRNKNRIGMIGRVDKFDHFNIGTDRPVRIASDSGLLGLPTKWRFIRRP